jgi:ABC-type transport system substrate-binding protein
VWTPIENVTYCIGGLRFGLYYQTGGKQGVQPPAGGPLEKLQQAYEKLISIVDENQRTAELLKAYQIHIDEGPLHIGTVGDLPSAIVAKNNFRNIQQFGFYGPSDLGFPGTIGSEQFFFKK